MRVFEAFFALGLTSEKKKTALNDVKFGGAVKSAGVFQEKVKGPYRCYYMSLFIVSICHLGYVNPTHFSQRSFIYEISCLFIFCLYSINSTEST